MKKPKKRHHFFLHTLLALIICAGFVWWGNNTLVTQKAEFFSSHLPKSFDGFTLVQLSDLHGKEFGSENETLLSTVAAAKPDMIALTGDLLDQYKSAPEGYVSKLSARLCAIAPTYYITGNHEWALGNVRALKETLKSTGVTVLSNQYKTLQRGEDLIAIAGIDDPNGYADQKTPEELATELHTEQGNPYWIFLAHRNERFEKQYSLLGADLTLTGHAHGGLIRLPVVGGVFSHDAGLFPGYTAGKYTENGADMFVSRGLGNAGPSFRVFNRPEVAIITLRYEND